MKKSVALFDLDGTIYDGHSFFGLIEYLIKRGVLKSETLKQMQAELESYRKKRQTYSEAASKMLEIFAWAIKGKNYDEVMQRSREFFGANRENFYGYFIKLLPSLKKTHDVYLVTANAQMVAEAVVEMFGLDGYLSSEYEVKEGKFTGKLVKSLSEGKAVVAELLEKYGGQTMAFGDSENDIEMLERAELAVCINPSPVLLVEALGRGWIIASDESGDVLELLGHG